MEFASDAHLVIQADHPVLLTQFLTSSGVVLDRNPRGVCRDDSECPSDYTCVPEFSACAPAACPREGPDGDAACFGITGYLSSCVDWSGLGPVCLAISDPSMLLVPPAEQHRRDYVFLAPLDYQIDFVNLVAPAGADVRLDGQPVVDWRSAGRLDGVQWQVATLEVSDGRHEVSSDGQVGLTVYGYDRDVSYGYPGGLNLERINDDRR